MTEQQSMPEGVAARLLGDPHPLTRQLVAPPEAAWGLAAASVLRPGAVRDVPSLRGFLTWYRTELLAPVELPLIRRAFDQVGNYQIRELLELDRALRFEQRFQAFAEASRAVGRAQLWRLLPLRDQRPVRRYWQAVETGQAHGWHVLVYGLVLSIFSLPLRPALLSYCRQTLAGFVDTAGAALSLPRTECAQLWADELALVPPAVDQALGPGRPVLTLCR